MGLFTGILNKVSSSIDVTSELPASPPPAECASPRQLQLATFYETLPISFPVCGYTVRIEHEGRSLSIHVSRDRIGDRIPDICGQTIEATRDEVRQFLHFYMMCPVGPRMFTFGQFPDHNRQRLQIVNYSLDFWRTINGVRDKHGRLKKSVGCICCISPKEFYKCCNRTKNPMALCHLHDRADALTIWNHEYFTARDEAQAQLLQLEKRLDSEAQLSQQPSQQLSDIAWEEKWRPVAAEIKYAATDRQIFYLLELGAQPKDLQGIDKDRAHDLIETLLENGDFDE